MASSQKRPHGGVGGSFRPSIRQPQRIVVPTPYVFEMLGRKPCRPCAGRPIKHDRFQIRGGESHKNGAFKFVHGNGWPMPRCMHMHVFARLSASLLACLLAFHLLSIRLSVCYLLVNLRSECATRQHPTTRLSQQDFIRQSNRFFCACTIDPRATAVGAQISPLPLASSRDHLHACMYSLSLSPNIALTHAPLPPPPPPPHWHG